MYMSRERSLLPKAGCLIRWNEIYRHNDVLFACLLAAHKGRVRYSTCQTCSRVSGPLLISANSIPNTPTPPALAQSHCSLAESLPTFHISSQLRCVERLTIRRVIAISSLSALNESQGLVPGPPSSNEFERGQRECHLRTLFSWRKSGDKPLMRTDIRHRAMSSCSAQV